MPKGYQFWLPKFWLPNLVLYQTDNLIYQSWRWSGYISIQISDLFLHTFSRKRPENFMDGRKDSWPDKRLKGLVGRKRMWSLTMWKLILSPKPSSWESYSISILLLNHMCNTVTPKERLQGALVFCTKQKSISKKAQWKHYIMLLYIHISPIVLQSGATLSTQSSSLWLCYKNVQ